MNISKQEIEHFLAIGELNSLLSSHPHHFDGFVSFCKSSVPTAGSMTIPRGKLNEHEAFMSLERVITHKNGFTLATKQGFIRFWESKLYACNVGCAA